MDAWRGRRLYVTALTLALLAGSGGAWFPRSLSASETIATDTTWSGSVAIDTSVEVPRGVTLTVEAGASLLLGEGVVLEVRGRLLALGTEPSPILFTRSEPGAEWGRVLLRGAEEAVFRHCVFEFSRSTGDHKDYYDDKDADCAPVEGERPPRDYHETLVAIACDVRIEDSTFRNLPRAGGEGDAIAIISDDPELPGRASGVIARCDFLEIGQGVHTRYAHVLVDECFFTGHHGDNDDVDLYGESDPPPVIRRSVFVDPEHDDMINPTRCSAIIEDNIIAGSDDHGIVLRDRCDPVLINNLIYDCRSAGVAVQNTCDALLINNTIHDCARGVRFFDHTGRWGLPYCLVPGSGRATLINTVIAGCPTPLLLTESPAVADPGSHVVVRSCVIEGGRAAISISGEGSTVTWGDGNIDGDPGFVSPEDGDYRPADGSILVDAGTSDGAPDHDLAGDPRPCGEGTDVGAYERGGPHCPPADVPFRRGDANADGDVDVSDPVFVLLHLFAGGMDPACQASLDADDSGALDISDAVLLLGFLFRGGDAPPAPGARTCGVDPTEDGLTCRAYHDCD